VLFLCLQSFLNYICRVTVCHWIPTVYPSRFKFIKLVFPPLPSARCGGHQIRPFIIISTFRTSPRQAANCEAINSSNTGAVSLTLLHKTDCRMRWQAASVTAGFRREVDENCALLGCYAASSGNFFTDVSGQHIGPIFSGFLILELRRWDL
jgi:hypothetical protein